MAPRRRASAHWGWRCGRTTNIYDAFPLAKPDEIIKLQSYTDLIDKADEFLARNVIIVPHGSFVEYMGTSKFEDMPIPTFGNRKVLGWESDRNKMREWLESAGIDMPRVIDDPKSIDRPVLVKYHGAKGGRGFFIAKDYMDFKMGIDMEQPYTIQEYILGTRYYLHYFYSPIKQDGYRVSDGCLELMSMDRRDESNIDEMYKLGAAEELKKLGHFPTFVVTGNIPVVIRESLLPKVLRDGREGGGTLGAVVRGHDRAVLPGMHRHRQAGVQGLRDLLTHRGRFQSLHLRFALFGPGRARHEHGQAHLPRDQELPGQRRDGPGGVMRTTLAIVDAELEVVPKEKLGGVKLRASSDALFGKREVILDHVLHADLVRAMPESNRRGRPDILHHALTLAISSIPYRMGDIDVVVHTRNNEAIYFGPKAEIPQNYFEFLRRLGDLYSDGQVDCREKRWAIEPNRDLAHIVAKSRAEVRVLTVPGRRGERAGQAPQGLPGEQRHHHVRRFPRRRLQEPGQ